MRGVAEAASIHAHAEHPPLRADAAACAADQHELPPHADLHDVQPGAVPRSGAGGGVWLLPVRVEEVGDCGRDGALSLTRAGGCLRVTLALPRGHHHGGTWRSSDETRGGRNKNSEKTTPVFFSQ